GAVLVFADLGGGEDDGVAHAGGDRGGGVHDADDAVDVAGPARLGAHHEGELRRVQAVLAAANVHPETVDVGGRHAGVGEGAANGFHGQTGGVGVQDLARLERIEDAGDHDFVQRVVDHGLRPLCAIAGGMVAGWGVSCQRILGSGLNG